MNECKSCGDTNWVSPSLTTYKHNAESIAKEFNVNADKLESYAKSGFAPCIISEDGYVLFSKSQIKDWIIENMFTKVEGKKVPFRLSVFRHEQCEDKKVIPYGIRCISGISNFIADIRPVVYFLVKDLKVVYVGQSNNLAARIGSHLKDAEKDFDNVFYIDVPSVEINDVEVAFIKVLNPKYNKMSTRECVIGMPLDDAKRIYNNYKGELVA